MERDGGRRDRGIILVVIVQKFNSVHFPLSEYKGCYKEGCVPVYSYSMVHKKCDQNNGEGQFCLNELLQLHHIWGEYRGLLVDV